MPCRIEFIKEAAAEYRGLDGSVRKKVDKRLTELSENPLIGHPLGRKLNMDLTGFYKLYAVGKKIRIVYRIAGTVLEIVEIWGIGRRDKEEIYRIVSSRIKRK